MQIDWWLLPRVAFVHTFSGIVWHMLQKWCHFNHMTLSWWPRHEIVSVTSHWLWAIWKEKRKKAEDRTVGYARAYWGSRDQLSSQIQFLFKSVHCPLYQEQYTGFKYIKFITKSYVTIMQTSSFWIEVKMTLLVQWYSYFDNDAIWWMTANICYACWVATSQWLTGKCHKITEFRYSFRVHDERWVGVILTPPVIAGLN